MGRPPRGLRGRYVGPMSGSDRQASGEWVHRPQQGPVAWGAAVLVAPAVPLLSLLVLLATIAAVPDDRVELQILPAPLPWLLLGGVLAWLGSGRILRGIGVGLLAGAAATFVLAAIAAYGSWR